MQTAIDLCAGAGGFTLGAKLAGVNVIAAVEINGPTADTYLRNHPTVNVFVADINRMETAWLPTTDGIIAGPPCQPFSDSGLGLSDGDDRNALPGVLRAIGELGPAWFVIENVPGMLSRHRDYLSRVLGVLRGYGYLVDYCLLWAHHFGVPQTRKRLFVAGRLDGRAWFWPQGNRGPAAAGDVLLPLLAEREPDRARFPDWALKRRPDLGSNGVLLSPQLGSGGTRVCARPLSRPSYTICGDGQKHGRRFMVMVEPGRGYTLREREVAALQGFPPGYYFSDLVEIGNCVPPPLAAAVIRAVVGE